MIQSLEALLDWACHCSSRTWGILQAACVLMLIGTSTFESIHWPLIPSTVPVPEQYDIRIQWTVLNLISVNPALMPAYNSLPPQKNWADFPLMSLFLSRRICNILEACDKWWHTCTKDTLWGFGFLYCWHESAKSFCFKHVWCGFDCDNEMLRDFQLPYCLAFLLRNFSMTAVIYKTHCV